MLAAWKFEIMCWNRCANEFNCLTTFGRLFVLPQETRPSIHLKAKSNDANPTMRTVLLLRDATSWRCSVNIVRIYSASNTHNSLFCTVMETLAASRVGLHYSATPQCLPALPVQNNNISSGTSAMPARFPWQQIY